MIYQIDITGMEWILGLGMAFGLAFLMTLLTVEDFSVFLGFLTMFISFTVWVGLLPAWTLILSIVILTISIYLQFQNNKRVG